VRVFPAFPILQHKTTRARMMVKMRAPNNEAAIPKITPLSLLFSFIFCYVPQYRTRIQRLREGQRQDLG
jgi:hypothetical protein